MHLSSYGHMEALIKQYLADVPAGKVLDIGSQTVVGQALSYRKLFEAAGWEYSGLDLVAGANVDIVADGTDSLPIADESYDLIVSGQAFEHISFFWLTFREMGRVLKPSGLIFLIAPSRGPEHRYPVDCWRFYPDGFQALADWAGLDLLAAETDWTAALDEDSALWGDTVGVFKKPGVDIPEGILDYSGPLDALDIPEEIEHSLRKPLTWCLGSRIDHSSAWTGHYLFAYWLVGVMHPKKVVELGAHFGASYFCFCSAVKHNGNDGRCHAVDLWSGDVHAGFYGDHVFDYVESVNQAEYADFSTLHKMSFDDALSRFEDGSVDLLHIDGCHTYDAVKGDFSTWLPKMSKRGVVLFHDINERRDDFGVWKFWDEIKGDYPHFSFDHSHGLGVLGVGEERPEELEVLFSTTPTVERADSLRRFFVGLNHLLLTKVSSDLYSYNSQLFLDSGAGFSEQDSVTKAFFVGTGVVEFAFNDLFVRQIRFDPCNTPCIVNITKVEAVYLNGTKGPLQPEWDNAFEKVGNTYFFGTDDPQILFAVDKVISRVRVELRVNPVIEEAATQLVQRINYDQAEIRRRLANSMKELEQLEHFRQEASHAQAAVRENEICRQTIFQRLKRTRWLEHLEGLAAPFRRPLIFWRHWRKGDKELIRESGLFHAEWYVQQYPDVVAADMDPLTHYVRCGAYEGRWPNPNFDALWYTRQYRSVLRWGFLPLVHYILYGQKRGFLTNGRNENFYVTWRTLRHRFLSKQMDKEAFFKSLAFQPRISILTPLYNTNKQHLTEALQSVRDQIYPNWELCLVDDASIEDLQGVVEEVFGGNEAVRYVKRAENGGIAAATNDALAMATGEYVCFLDHDDLLEPHALASMVVAVNQNPDGDWFYSDEDKISENGDFFGPLFKPDWDPVLYMSCMYTCHLSMYRKELVERIGGFDPAFDGTQDFEMSLRLLKTDPRIVHVPDVLYHWRMCEGSTALDLDSKPEAFKRQVAALNNYLRDTSGHVEDGSIHGMHKVQYAINGRPSVTIIIPSAGRQSHVFTHTTYVEHLVESIQDKSSYVSYSISVSVNPDLDPGVRKRLEDRGCTVLDYVGEPFNLSDKINALVASCDSDYVVLLNDDMEIISEDWLEQMLMWIQQDRIGCVGAQLLFPNDTIQHAGVVFFPFGPGHVYYGENADIPGYLGAVQFAREYSAVTGACMMFRKDDFLRVGGFASEFHMNYNDVDFCWKLRTQLNKSIVYTPEAKLYHYESVSKDGVAPTELEAINIKWGSRTLHDPYFSRHHQPCTFEPRQDSTTPLEEYCSKLK